MKRVGKQIQAIARPKQIRIVRSVQCGRRYDQPSSIVVPLTVLPTGASRNNIQKQGARREDQVPMRVLKSTATVHGDATK